MVFEEMIIIFNVELVSSFHNVEYIFRYVKLKSIITQRVPQVKVMSDYPAKNTGCLGETIGLEFHLLLKFNLNFKGIMCIYLNSAYNVHLATWRATYISLLRKISLNTLVAEGTAMKIININGYIIC